MFNDAGAKAALQCFFIQDILQAVTEGNLSHARQIAQTKITPECQQEASNAYRNLADKFLLSDDFKVYHQNNPLKQITFDEIPVSRPTPKRVDPSSCWDISENEFLLINSTHFAESSALQQCVCHSLDIQEGADIVSYERRTHVQKASEVCEQSRLHSFCASDCQSRT